ncbi:MAG: TonB-dependent receptor domain-containing protein, partial [Arenimonas sp.]
MRHGHRIHRHVHALATAVVLALAGSAHAQLSTSTIKGQITSAGAAAQAGLVVTAVNPATGNTYRSTTLADGSYVLTGLAPGSYEIRVAGPGGTVKTQVITVQVGETAAVDLALTGTVTQMEQVVVVGSALRQSVRDSQVGTSVSQKMIESLPQVTRNFLSSADLAPGVAFSTDSGGNTKIQSGSQDFDHVNVFIDGIGQKNNILRGGLSGQDSSRGNPFPQSAIAEYRVLTQNYKAEFDQVSSAAITAITKSGTNEFHGDAYVDRTSTRWRSKTVFEKEREAQGIPLPPSSKHEYGVSLGGPIIQDRVHFFVAYDGKDIDSSRQIVVQNLNRLPSLGVVPSLIAAQGSQVDPFLENLLFGKVDAEINPEHRLSLSTRVRRESDRRPENSTLSAHGNDKDRTNDETRLDLKHEWARDAWLSEARVGYEYYRWNPHSAATEPFIMYRVSTATPQRISGASAVLFVGGSPDAQDRAQRGNFVSEELTYTGLTGHLLKGGARIKAMKYDLSGASLSVDSVNVLIDTVTGQPYYDGTNCTGTNITNNGLNSDQCAIRRATAPNTAAYKNEQIGLYLQDDWAVSTRLELNLGARYDYETNMINNKYVTPADRVAGLNQVDR